MSVAAERTATASFRRFHRLRRTPALRDLVRETRLDPTALVLPLFVDANAERETPIASLDGHSRWPADAIERPVERAVANGVRAFLLFGLPETKDEEGRCAADPLGPVPGAPRRLRPAHPGG